MEIRPANFGDIKKIKKIADVCAPNISPHPSPLYFLLHIYPASIILVAEDKTYPNRVRKSRLTSEITGFLIAFQNPITRNIYLHQLAVSPKHRKKGIGKVLLQNIMEKFKGKKLSFGVRKFNTHALNFYKKLGFKIVSEHFYFDKMFKMERK